MYESDKEAERYAPFMIVLTCVLLCLLVSKGNALLPGYSVDDYLLTYADADPGMYLSQGRYTEVALQWLTRQLGLRWSDIYFPNIVLLLLAYGALISLAVLAVRPARTSLAIPCIGGAIIACHPFFSALLAFREAALNSLCCIVLLVVFLHAWLHLTHNQPLRQCWSTHLLAALALAGALGCYQPALGIALCITLPIVMQRAFSMAQRPLREIGRQWRLGIPMLLAVAFYILLNRFLTWHPDVVVDPRSQIVGWAELPQRLRQFAELLYQLLLGGTALESALLIKAQGLLLLLGLISIGWRTPLKATAFLILYLFLVVLSVAPLALSSIWWPALRAAIASGFALGMLATMTLACAGRLTRPLAAGWLFVCWGLALHSSALLLDQARLNRWDISQAQLLVQDIRRQFPDLTRPRISLVPGQWRYPATLQSAMHDHGESAFATPWAIQGLLREATGQELEWVYPEEADKERCTHSPHWPGEGSLLRKEDVIHVCL
ncbi:glucosyltransferase domain-containing protein [Pseudomonas jinjuensis]|uniref:Glucosyl transferase GtrII n=1 Tax=Pseudomonas jinjuensis TaxID=198616 RepID=A0A1H0MQR8_9PSED|nr:glucosyltransferase domain-containing protein [Pseudomonas jinjuensis]SDO82752.1 Glucosyl transferase GtrII [Pseudomonas jinjuensis]